MTPQEQKIVQHIVQSTGLRLSEAVVRLGGERARKGLVTAFDAAVEASACTAADKRFKVEIDGIGWEIGATLLQALIDHADDIVGKHSVERELSSLLDETETRAGASLYEVYFRLGLHGYR